MEQRIHTNLKIEITIQVWNQIMLWSGFKMRSCKWNSVFQYVNQQGRNYRANVRRMIVAAAVYGVWFERNIRLHSNAAAGPDMVTKRIKVSVLSSLYKSTIPPNIRSG